MAASTAPGDLALHARSYSVMVDEVEFLRPPVARVHSHPLQALIFATRKTVPHPVL